MIVKPLEKEWNRSGKKSPPESQTGGETEKNSFRRIYTMRKSIAITLILTIVLSICAVMPAALAEAYYIRTDNGKTVNLSANAPLGTTSLSGYNILGQSRTISGTAFNVSTYYEVDVDGNGVSQYANNKIYVTQVIGYK